MRRRRLKIHRIPLDAMQVFDVRAWEAWDIWVRDLDGWPAGEPTWTRPIRRALLLSRPGPVDP